MQLDILSDPRALQLKIACQRRLTPLPEAFRSPITIASPARLKS
jgi:hypothetical protein